MEFVKIKSRAKINLTLDVLGKRDDGYHELEMIMQTLSLYDSVYIKKLVDDEIVVKSNLEFLPTDKRNLAYKAAELIKERFKIKQGVFIDLNKRIPVAAGLAGGSGNCAAVLKGMNKIFNLGLSMEQLMEIGLELGSDVPYCIMESTALAKGRGEILTRLKPCPHFYVVLAKPSMGISTAFVYNNLDLQNVNQHPNTKKVIEAIEIGDKQAICNGLVNVLENVSIKFKPVVKDIKESMKKNGADGVLMSGSGLTVFGLFEDEEKAKKAVKAIKMRFKIKDVYLTETENC